MTEPLLQVQDLKVNLRLGQRGEVTVVDGLSFSMRRGETLGIVGESGCGKTMTASAIIGLLPSGTGRIAGGRILFDGEELTKKTPGELRTLRGRKMSMIFQDPMSSLNPVYRIGTQMREALQVQERVSRKEAEARSVEMLRKVGIALPETRIREYPHQLSGGQRQRVMIAMALLTRPALLIADEPTSSLDVTIQAQILELIRKLRDETGTAVLLITHDLGVMAGNADRVLVMYAGRAAEYGTADEIFTNPLHPYTRGLLASIPRADTDMDRLSFIPGVVPPLNAMPTGCRFRTRCPQAHTRCAAEQPAVVGTGSHIVYCHRCREL